MRAILYIICASVLFSVDLPAVTASSPPTQKQTLHHIDSLWTIGERDAFWEVLDSELAQARVDSDRPYIARLLLRRGEVRARLGMGSEAEPDLREALSLTRSLDKTDLQCRCLRWLGVALERQGRSDEAAEIWQELLPLAQEAENLEQEAWAWTGLAYQDQWRGRARDSRGKYTQAIERFSRLHHVRGELFASIGLGTTLDDLGEYEEALAIYQRSAKDARERGLTWLEARAVNNVAVLLYKLGDPGEARRGFQRAHELQVADGDYSEAILTGVNFAYCEADLGRHDEAVTSLENLRAECSRYGIGKMALFVDESIAVVRQRQGRHRLAVTIYRDLMEREHSLSAQNRVETLLGLSISLTEIDSMAIALELMRGQAAWCRTLDNQQLRLQFETELGRLLLESGEVSDALSILVGAGRQAGRLGHAGYQLSAVAHAARAARELALPDSALALLRQGKRIWEVDRGLPADPEWREMRSASAQAIYTQLGSLMLDHPLETPAAVRAQQAFDVLQVFKARTLIERMLGPRGDRVPKRAPDPVGYHQLQEQILGSDEMLLDYYLGEEESILFAVTRHDCRALRLPPRDELEKLITLYYHATSKPPTAHVDKRELEVLRESAERIGELLLGPVLDRTPAVGNLIVIPDGIVNLISFHGLLESVAGRQENQQVSRMLTVQFVPSATIFAALRQRDEDRGKQPRTVRRILALHGENNSEGERLDGAVEEVAALSRSFDGVESELVFWAVSAETLMTEGEMVDAVPLALDRFDVLHFASHASTDDQHPWRSKIDLRGTPGPEGNRDLLASEIAGYRLTAKLAVLSSCRSAGGRIVSGEGVQGLASAFLSAGVPTVVATLWPVDDHATSRMIGLFYGGLARGQTSASALAGAQRILRGERRTSHPFYWAGFVLIGDGDSRLDLAARRSIPRYLAPLILAIVGILGIVAPRLIRRRNGRML